jgi:hypothetical protein
VLACEDEEEEKELEESRLNGMEKSKLPFTILYTSN